MNGCGIGMSVLAGVALMLSGCQALNGGNGKQALGFDGIPGSEFLVGGGYVIRYRARVEGTLYLADENSQRLLATVSLQAGEAHHMEFDIEDEKLAANLDALGIDPQLASFKLYFVPYD
jgi:hypothetical protein